MLSEVYRATPTATFTSEGGMGQGDNLAKSTGTVTVAGPAELPHDDFVADITYGSEKPRRYTIQDRRVVEVGRVARGVRRREQRAADPGRGDGGAHRDPVARRAGQRDLRADRPGLPGIVPGNLTGDMLKLLLVEYAGDAVDRSLVTYTLTIDERNRPVSFVLDVGRPLGDAGLFTTTFRSTYTDFRSR